MLAEILREVKCCLRCFLRLSGEQSRRPFAVDCSSEEVHAALRSRWKSSTDAVLEAVQSHSNQRSCSLCIGALQDSFLRKCGDMVTKKILEENYDNNTFSMNAIIPNCLSIRQHSFCVYLKEKLRGFDDFKLDNITTIKDALKSGLIAKVERETGKNCDSRSHFRVTVIVHYEDDAQETSKIPKAKTNQVWRKRKFDGSQTIGSIQNFLAGIDSVESLLKYSPCPPKVSDKVCILKDVCCFHESIIVGGRYNKYSRELSQTPWFIDGVRKTETSVQELACEKISKFFRADDLKFISAGREDVDVRMLGSGRPFAVELINPRKIYTVDGDMKTLEISTNESTNQIAVKRLQVVSKSDLALLKEGEEHKIKFYRAGIYAKSGFSDEQLAKLKIIRNLVIKQKTPVRVLHRRPLAVREKVIHQLSATRIDKESFDLFLSTQAGTYIKEFVHGDFRRTEPSLGALLGSDVDIVELDVEEVELEWPPSKEKVKHVTSSNSLGVEV